MKDSEIKYFTVNIQFLHSQNWFSFRVPHNTWLSLREKIGGYNTKELKNSIFLQFATSSKVQVVFRHEHVRLIHLSWDPLHHEPEEDFPNDEIQALYSNSDKLEVLDVMNSESAHPFYCELVGITPGDSQFVCFEDSDGEETFVNPYSISLIVFPEHLLDYDITKECDS